MDMLWPFLLHASPCDQVEGGSCGAIACKEEKEQEEEEETE